MGVLSHFGTDLLAQTPVTTTCDSNAQTLKKGNAGEIVVTLQNLLVEKGYIDRDYVDGDFGPGTDAVVKQFQTDNSLTADGIVGPATWQVLCPTTGPFSDETPGMMRCPDDIITVLHVRQKLPRPLSQVLTNRLPHLWMQPIQFIALIKLCSWVQKIYH